MVEFALNEVYHEILDPQREKEYAWEDEFIICRRRLFRTINQARAWIKWACEQYKVPVPVVVEQRDNRDYSCYRPDRHRIQLLKRHWNPWAALHEAAHAICHHKWGILGHGPKFLGVLIWLLKENAIAPQSALTASAKAAGLRFTQIGRVAPDHLKVKKRKVTRKR